MKAIITPVAPREGRRGMFALAQQFGGLAGGIAPSSASQTELVGLLKSNSLRKGIIERYQLLPILFNNQWDEKKNTWKKGKGSHFSLNPLALVSKIRTGKLKAGKGEKDAPDTWDGLRALDGIVKVVYNANVITISADFHDPEMAARMVEYFLSSLNDHLSSEAKRVAAINKKYLEEQLGEMGDNLIWQKIYNIIIAEQIETAMMAEVKENFAFKVLDPPLAPDRKIQPKRTRVVIIAFFREYLEKIKAADPGGTDRQK